MKDLLSVAVASLVVSALLPSAIERDVVSPVVFVVYFFPVVFLLAAAICLPFYKWLSLSSRNRIAYTAPFNFLVSSVSFAAISWLSKPDFSQVGAAILVQGGSYTASGALQMTQQSFAVGLTAVIGTCVFHMLHKRLAGA
ncbi:hypothetical protein E2F46_16540 [Luteimonas aestuarii]|uniref:Uncharacterized protein n=1 Tax=Luteimonas aestuarii TaxID=453837 RepID=A0A4R5TSQ5_9GAMM|nr:hypothetical protein [Luteimonas aestuarii]TDK19972.1 hypothetical protein E2F46_16540 [Luteimonas aestuarii]